MSLQPHAPTIDCRDAAALAAFWSAALGRAVDADPTPEFAGIGMGDAGAAFRLAFIQVPEPKQGKNRVHVDFASADREADVARLVALGASRMGDFDEDGYRWTTLADPEGNEFDVVASS